MHREKDHFTKYGGVFILAHDSFNLMLNALHTEIFLSCRRLYKLVYLHEFLFIVSSVIWYAHRQDRSIYEYKVNIALT